VPNDQLCAGRAPCRRDLDTDRLRRLAETRPDVATVRTSGCLGSCDYGDVVVVRPSWLGCERGARPVWVGFVDDDILVTIEQWILDGGPRVAPTPVLVENAAIRLDLGDRDV
jgi:(2Fe-2S) ferredoxin